MTPHAIVYDCEFLTAEGSPSRFWCGPYDPDPVIAQIGLVRIALTGDFAVTDTLRLHVIPTGRDGTRLALDPFFTRLTGITEAEIDRTGLPLAEALARTDRFSDGARLWSWGKDEFNIATSCYVAGQSMPIPITRFGNACHLMLAGGMPYEDLRRTPSNRLAAYFGVDVPDRQDHDALDDALSLAHALQHLLRQGRIAPDAFE
jgi:hypothetical protein